MTPPKIFLGADLGGTWLRLCLAQEGRPPRRARLRAVPWRQLPQALSLALARWGKPRLERLVVGATGLGRRADQRLLETALSPFARRVEALSDLELAHRAAFEGGRGILVVAGTGSAALGRDAGGRRRRAGGWGALLGDEGSAFWLGREALKDKRLSRLWPADLPLRLARDPRCVRKTAALAKAVLARASRGGAAARLRRRAAAQLAALAVEALRGLRGGNPWPLCVHGSLFRDQALKTEMAKLLPRSRFRSQEPALRAEDAAALLPLL